MNATNQMATQDNNAVARAGQNNQATLRPPVDVVENADGIVLYADLPGVSKDKLNLQIDADTLIIEGESELSLPEDLEAGHTEVSVPRYRRVFSLSRDMDSEKVSAELKNGVLKLTIPRAEHAQPRKIQVTTD